jgi:hypothetical protein
MTPPRASDNAPILLLTSSGAHAAEPPPPHKTALRSAGTSLRGARQSSSELFGATTDAASAHPHGMS